jgi:hypothetical protein
VLEPNIRVCRYMSFAKLVSMLQSKRLWLSASESLGDKWEVMFDGPQMNTLINRRPPDSSPEAMMEQAKQAIRQLRKRTFVNCWTASKHESHALWRIYCPSPEGVAIQTTLDRLKKSIALPVREVVYGTHGTDGTLPDIAQLVTQKRPMFAYEQEVRIVLVKDFTDPKNPERITSGVDVEWDPEKHLEQVWVHPDAPFWFMETVTETVRQLAPGLSHNGIPMVPWSTMNSSPPL